MTPALRKYHRAVWFGMAALLPALFTAAVLVIPRQVSYQPLLFSQPEQLSKLVRSDENNTLRASFRTDENGQSRQLEVEVLQPLTTAGALVYLAPGSQTSMEESTLLGSLAGRGIYRFDLTGYSPEPPVAVYFFDPVRNHLFATLNLQ